MAGLKTEVCKRAIFGALGLVFIRKNWKIAMAPLVCMLALFLIAPNLAGATAVLAPVGILISVTAARVLYKKEAL